MVQQSDFPIFEIARNLDINDNMIRRGVKEHADLDKKSFPGHGTPSDAEITHLKRERVNWQHYVIRVDARADVFHYSERFYNQRKKRKLMGTHQTALNGVSWRSG